MSPTAVFLIWQEQRKRLSLFSTLSSPATSTTALANDIYKIFTKAQASKYRKHRSTVEQLPLSLYRSFTLLNELDAQAHAHESELLPTIRGYDGGLEALSSGDILPNSASRNRRIGDRAEFSPIHFRIASRGKKRLLAYPVNYLLDLSMLSNDLLRASEEKVNLAKATYNSVDRHVRLLDQAIKEHESHINSDLCFRTGLSLAESSLRSSIRGATGSRNARNTEQPTSIFMSNSTDYLPAPGRRTQRLLAKEPESNSAGTLVTESELKRLVAKPDRNINTSDRNNTTTFRPTFKAKMGSTALSSGDMPIDPHEPRYCYCNQVSWGEMIACDADDCDREWFHLGCAGLTEAPKGKSKWYCNACKERVTSGARKRVH
ncbi:hypothetical protein EW145_g1065 [Phellinidium pouzarii]|uniref:Chromatin modification-related protein n=1 Tax=Phellinidium pouzarii TaxID=167371 RepID=A0A4S4LGJ1_9AGAM|nr:hypothetical protein EW145_g1065 [Phellinidium pouzarii]